MKVSIPQDLLSQLQWINLTQINQGKKQGLLKQLESKLNQIGFSLDSTLVEVMGRGNHLTLETETNKQSNFYKQLYHAGILNIVEYGNAEGFNKSEIEYIESGFLGRIQDVKSFEEPILKPVVQWDRQSIAYYCLKDKYNLVLSDVLFWLLTFEYGEKQWVDSFSVANALHELSYGTACSLYVGNSRLSNNSNTLMELIQRGKPDMETEFHKELNYAGFDLITATKVIAWMGDLGIISALSNRTSNDINTMSKILGLFIGVKPDTIRRMLVEILSTNIDNNNLSKNHPLNNDKNKKFIDFMNGYYSVR